MKAARCWAAIFLILGAAHPASGVEEQAVRPRPADIVTGAGKGLLLDVTRVGPAWIAVGDHGLVLRSGDAKHWQQITVPVDTTLNRVRFLDEARGWIVGYDGCVLKTVDGGRSWQIARYEGSGSKPYFDVWFSNRHEGWLAGSDGLLQRSRDGGATWESVITEALQDRLNLYAFTPLHDGSLLIAGERGFIARSRDHGLSWSVLKSPYSGAYFGVLPVAERGVLIFGLRGNAFYAADLDRAPLLSATDREALRVAADDPQASALAAGNPVSAVAGWIALSGADGESLFSGARTTAGSLLLFGNNGRVMQADLNSYRLKRLSQAGGANYNAGALAGDALILVGSAGLQRLPLPH